jgi:hypothetical protein
MEKGASQLRNPQEEIEEKRNRSIEEQAAACSFYECFSSLME